MKKLTLVVVSYDSLMVSEIVEELQRMEICDKVDIIFTHSVELAESTLEKLADVYFIGRDERDFWSLYERKFVPHLGGMLSRVKSDQYKIPQGFWTATHKASDEIAVLCKKVLSQMPIND